MDLKIGLTEIGLIWLGFDFLGVIVLNAQMRWFPKASSAIKLPMFGLKPETALKIYPFIFYTLLFGWLPIFLIGLVRC